MQVPLARWSSWLTQLAWQIEAPRATIRGPDVVDALFSIPLLRSEHYL